ncbi:MAG TPA: ABC transporter ATP-binding protein [Thermodesulfobacteriaceae bacterium]|nr:ABC transporter ATP-binding protein [Thermodesulfobacteriaceae bacterium]
MIQIENLTRKYGDFTAVNNVDFQIGRGEIVGLLGHNAAGKTTIMKMLTGCLEPTGGNILIDGMNMGTHCREIQGKIGYLPENCPVYPEMTVVDFLDYTASLHGVTTDRTEKIRRAIKLTELQSKAAQYISTLSRGYRQRVGVAQAILHGPEILILDEPTNGLDPTQIQHMRDLIRDLAREATVIISTHILQEVQAVCDRVIIIRNGKKALDSTMEELRSGNRLIVATDMAHDMAADLFGQIPGMDAVEFVSGNGRFEYALVLHDRRNMDQTASSVADLILRQGSRLYALYPESRDLETIFGEISSPEGGILS